LYEDYTLQYVLDQLRARLTLPVIIIFSFLIPHSPRWLLSKDREEEALAALKRLRPKADAEDGTCEAEIQTIRAALQEHVHKGPWIDLFRGTNLRRTMLVIVFYFYQQVSRALKKQQILSLAIS
jgi:hypothetical protein